MDDPRQKVILTGFMGVGKSTVARHLSQMLGCQRIDLDGVIQEWESRTIAEIISQEGIERFREIESQALGRALAGEEASIIALGGGAWTLEENRRLIKSHGFTTIWLESTFEHCWLNIQNSKRVRPLAKDKAATRRLFDERRRVYCLADWHFIVRPDFNSYEVARQIAEEVFSVTVN
jgi:shikimate kinase